jgi:hypothetical protein
MHPSVFVGRQTKGRAADPCSVDLVLAQCSRSRTLLFDVRHSDDLGVDWLNAADGRLVALETLRVR